MHKKETKTKLTNKNKVESSTISAQGNIKIGDEYQGDKHFRDKIINYYGLSLSTLLFLSSLFIFLLFTAWVVYNSTNIISKDSDNTIENDSKFIKNTLDSNHISLNDLPKQEIVKKKVGKRNSKNEKVKKILTHITFTSINEGLAEIAFFQIAKRLSSQGIYLIKKSVKTKDNQDLDCNIQVNQKEVELGASAIQISFTVTMTLYSAEGQIIKTPLYLSSSVFFIDNESDIPNTFEYWISHLNDDLFIFQKS